MPRIPPEAKLAKSLPTLAKPALPTPRRSAGIELKQSSAWRYTVGRRAVEVRDELREVGADEADGGLLRADEREVLRVVCLERLGAGRRAVDDRREGGARSVACRAGLLGDHANEPVGRHEVLEVIADRLEAGGRDARP